MRAVLLLCLFSFTLGGVIEESDGVISADELQQMVVDLFQDRDGRAIELSEDTEDDLVEVDEEEAKALTAEVEPATAEVEVRETDPAEILKFNGYVDAVLRRMNAGIRAKRMDPMVINLNDKNVKNGKKGQNNRSKKQRSTRSVDEDEDEEEIEGDDEVEESARMMPKGKGKGKKGSKKGGKKGSGRKETSEEEKAAKAAKKADKATKRAQKKKDKKNMTKEEKEAKKAAKDGDKKKNKNKGDKKESAKSEKKSKKNGKGKKGGKQERTAKKTSPHHNHKNGGKGKKGKSDNPLNEGKTAGSLSGIATLRREGDVEIYNIGSDQKKLKAEFTVGPLTLEVSKSTGSGKSRSVKSAKAITSTLNGKMVMKVKADGSAHVKSVFFKQPEKVNVKGSLSKRRSESDAFLKKSIKLVRPIAALRLLKIARYTMKTPATIKA